MGAVVAELARLTGRPVDAGDTHSRWEVYLAAMGSADCTDLLFRAVHLESDHALALSIVLRMFEELPAKNRGNWAAQLGAEKDRNYAATRRDEMAILESAQASETDVAWDEADALGWSDWLQTRLAGVSNDSRLLQWLTERGHTKRIRKIARDRLEVLNQA